MPMNERDEIERLNWRLRMHNTDPVTAMARQAAASLFPLIQSIGDGLIGSAPARPLITLLLSFEAGFAVARLGRKHAQR
jgi:type III secretory pathway component EscV